MKEAFVTLSVLFYTIIANAQYVNMDSLVKAEEREEKKILSAAKVKVILFGLPYLAASTGVELTVQNFSNKTIKNAFVSVKAIDTGQHVVGTEV